MEQEELFSLKWIGTSIVAEAINLKRINEVYKTKLRENMASSKQYCHFLKEIRREQRDLLEKEKIVFQVKNSHEAGQLNDLGFASVKAQFKGNITQLSQ